MNKILTYSDKLKLPMWQKMRLEILTRDKFTCQFCQADDKMLHVHHKYYITDKDPWDYPENAFITLCCDCHEFESEDLKSTSGDLFLMLRQAGATSRDFYKLSTGFVLADNSRFNNLEILEFLSKVLKSSELQDYIKNKI